MAQKKRPKSVVYWGSEEEELEVKQVFKAANVSLSGWLRTMALNEVSNLKAGKGLPISPSPRFQPVATTSKPVVSRPVEKTEAELEEEKKQTQKKAKEARQEMLKRFRS